MKHQFATLLLCLLIPFAGLAQDIEKGSSFFLKEPTIEVDYDKDAQRTLINLKPLSIKAGLIDEFGIYAGYTYPGQSAEIPKIITFGFAYTSIAEEYTPQFERSHDLTLLVDGERMALGVTGYQKNSAPTPKGTMHVETMMLRLPRVTFARIAKAKSVEARLGSFETKLEEKHLNGLRALLDF